MDFLSSPGDGSVRTDERNKRVEVAVFNRPLSHANLDGDIGFPFCRTRRFEIDGGEGVVGDHEDGLPGYAGIVEFGGGGFDDGFRGFPIDAFIGD